MSHHDHAQQIYAAILAAWAASGRPLPSAEDAEKFAAQAIGYAKAFDKAARGATGS